MAQALNKVVEKTGAPAGDVSDVVLGIVSQVNEQGACLAATPCSPPAGPRTSPAPPSTATAARACRP